jgi:hypothetical protein
VRSDPTSCCGRVVVVVVVVVALVTEGVCFGRRGHSDRLSCRSFVECGSPPDPILDSFEGSQPEFELYVRLYLAYGDSAGHVCRGVRLRTSDHNAISPAKVL